MALLIIQTDEARSFPIGNFATVGRDGSNSIVIRHPTVSRTHAKIAISNGVYYLTDTGSRNGTRVNGKPVREPLALKDGARLRIGHVRAWFFKERPAHTPEPVAPRAEHIPDAGIVFACTCGTRLWSASDAIGMLVACGSCGASNTVPRKSDDDDSADTVAGVVYQDDAVEKNVCGICQWEIESDDDPHVCPSCGLHFHTECWRENKGCSSYGCDQVNVLARPAGTPARTATDQGYTADEDSAGEPQSRIAWEYVLLAFSVLGTLLGLFTFGIPAAGVAAWALGRLLLAKRDKKTILVIAMLLAVVGAAAGTMVSRMWWLDEKLF